MQECIPVGYFVLEEKRKHKDELFTERDNTYSLPSVKTVITLLHNSGRLNLII